MQPYIFPYLGYFQMLKYADLFVLYNDVNFIERGWINRNYILTDKGKSLFTVPLNKASSNKLINEVEVICNNKRFGNILKSIQQNYRKAIYFNEVFPLIEKVFDIDKPISVDLLAKKSIMMAVNYLNINTTIQFSSNIKYNRDADKVTKLIEIAKYGNAKTVVFPSGSRQLYSDTDFIIHGIKSLAITPRFESYHQVNTPNEFVPSLSIIDILMNVSIEKIHSMLDNIELSGLDE